MKIIKLYFLALQFMNARGTNTMKQKKSKKEELVGMSGTVKRKQ